MKASRLIRRVVWALGGVLVLAAGLVVAGVLALRSQAEGTPVVQRAVSYPSPDGEWQATLEEVDNGLGMGLGALFHEVRLHRTGAPIAGHGDPDASVVFYLDAEEAVPPSIRWVGARHLVVQFEAGPMHQPGRTTERVGDVTIEYQRLARRP